MKLTNAMEEAVKHRLAVIRSERAADREFCWCPLCRADIMALALSSLPPRYLTRERPSATIDPDLMALVVDEVDRSVDKVRRFPKHARGSAVAAGEPVWIVNFPLEEGFGAIDQVLRGRDDACDCWSCRCDTVAFALNRYPARYGVEFQGKTHLRDGDRLRMREELFSFLGLGAQVAGTVPRH